MTTEPSTIYLKDYQPYPFVLNQVELFFTLEDHCTEVQSILSFSRKAEFPKHALFLHGDEVTLRSIALNGKILASTEYQLSAEGLEISNVPDEFTLALTVQIDPKNNTQLMGLYKTGTAFCTQCEAHGFRRITFFPDRPDVMTRFTVTINADRKHYPYLLSNGNLLERKELPNGWHQVKWQDPSLKPCYLFALVAGDFDILEDRFITMSGRNVDLQLFVEKGYRDQGVWAMASLKRAMKWDEETFGREYDLDIFMTVAVFDFNFGAMENKGLNIFNAKYILAKSATATDRDYILIEEVVAHEYFHNWSGDRVTCRDWFQLTLKEGLTVFRDQSFTADMTSRAVKRIEDANVIRDNQFLQDAGPMAHPIQPQFYMEVNNFYTVTVYNKGAEVIRMVQTILGKKTFRKAMDLYFSRHDGQAVTTEDFIKCMEDASGIDLSQFRRWYVQAGTPVLEINDEFDIEDNEYHLHIKQSCAATADHSPKEPFMIPLAVGLLNRMGQDIPLQLKGESTVAENTKVLWVTAPEQTFTFINVTENPTPSLLRNFSAPVKVQYAYSAAQLSWLMVNDRDAFNRWDAGQELAKRILLGLADDVQQKRDLTLNPLLVKAFRTIIESEKDLSLAALNLTLPSESYLLQQMTIFDPDVVHQAREFARQQLAKELRDVWQKTYSELNDGKPYEYNTLRVGRRALKNLILSYLLKNEEPEWYRQAYEQFTQADNMTDTMGALIALNNFDCLERGAALAEFYDKWADDPLVVDKWLSLQASSFLPDTLTHVKALLNHPAYHAKNPNKIRALIGTFSTNFYLLHQLNGEGYRFLAEQVIIVDKINSMTAARLVAPLIQWQKFDAQRQQLMQAELKRILATPELSKDVYEVVSKALAV